MIHVIATLRAKDGQRDTLAAAFRENLPLVRAKAGCRGYSLAVHTGSGLRGQLPFDANELLVVEKWDDVDALKSHLADPQFQTWYGAMWHLVANATMQVLEEI